MYIRSEPLDPRIFWPILPLLSKLYILFLCIVIIYTLCSLSRILFRFYALKKLSASNETHSVPKALAGLRRTATNIHQLILFTFFLYALIFFLQIPAAFMIFGDYKAPPLGGIIQDLSIYFAIAAEVFFVLLLLHSAHWFVSARLSSAEIRLTLPH
jgi:hypothetical protein